MCLDYVSSLNTLNYIHIHSNTHLISLTDTLTYTSSNTPSLPQIPRIYIAANSGARIGLAEEIKHMFKVAWEDPTEPDKVSHSEA